MGSQCALFAKNTYDSVSASMPLVYQARSRLIGHIGQFIGLKLFQIQNLGDIGFGRFSSVYRD
jgi:hypothetical protein